MAIAATQLQWLTFGLSHITLSSRLSYVRPKLERFITSTGGVKSKSKSFLVEESKIEYEKVQTTQVPLELDSIKGHQYLL